MDLIVIYTICTHTYTLIWITENPLIDEVPAEFVCLFYTIYCFIITRRGLSFFLLKLVTKLLLSFSFQFNLSRKDIRDCVEINSGIKWFKDSHSGRRWEVVVF